MSVRPVFGGSVSAITVPEIEWNGHKYKVVVTAWDEHGSSVPLPGSDLVLIREIHNLAMQTFEVLHDENSARDLSQGVQVTYTVRSKQCMAQIPTLSSGSQEVPLIDPDLLDEWDSVACCMTYAVDANFSVSDPHSLDLYMRTLDAVLQVKPLKETYSDMCAPRRPTKAKHRVKALAQHIKDNTSNAKVEAFKKYLNDIFEAAWEFRQDHEDNFKACIERTPGYAINSVLNEDAVKQFVIDLLSAANDLDTEQSEALMQCFSPTPTS